MENNAYIQRFLQRFQSANDEAVAFSIYDGNQVENITYRQFLKDILNAAGYFKKNNIHKQHVALVAHNSYTWLVTYFAISAAGNTVVLMNPDLPVELLQRQCDYADVTLVCVQTLPECGALAGSAKWVPFSELKSDDSFSLDAIWHHQPDETVVMMFTSGTTGKSKAVEYSAENIQSYLDDLLEILELPDRLLLIAPLHHILGLVSALSRLDNEQTVCIGRGSRNMLMDIPKLNPTFIPMVPLMLESIVKLLKNARTKEQQERYLGNQLKGISVGGAGVKPDVCRCFMERGIKIHSAYGLTETTGAGTFGSLSIEKIRSVGKLYGRTQIKIADGELLLKGPSVMKGYYKDPEETAKVIKDGWLYTGDMGYCDEDGYYYITGRKKNVIILSNGENVNPEEIEAAFGECSAIEEVLIYSDGKGICADVFTQKPDIAAAYIKAYNANMPMYRQVYKVNYTEEPLPKTGSGKIKRKENL